MTDDKAVLTAKAYTDIRYSMYSVYEQYARKHGLGFKNFFVLRVLYMNSEGCTQNDICSFSVVSKQTVSAIMKSFLSKDYITMEGNMADKRNKLVKLTETGREFAEKVVAPVIKAEESVMSLFTTEQRAVFLTLSALYTENLKEYL